MNPPLLLPRTAEEVVAAVNGHERLLPVGGGTKPALSSPPPGYVALGLSALAGIIEHDPGEYTFTAFAGTPLAVIESALSAHGQYLPFDPPFGEAGATLGGSIAAGLSGPGRYRYGGLRDFILGVRFVTGEGELVRGGAKVVKNAAGFDLPKLLVGSAGRLGVIVEATLKVFPRPRATVTLCVDFPDLEMAVSSMARLGRSSFDLEGVELLAPATMWLRLGGDAGTLAERLDRLEKFVGGRATRLEGSAEMAAWTGLRLKQPASEVELLVKVPLTLAAIAGLDGALAAGGAKRRYSAGGNVAWINWTGTVDALDALLRHRSLTGLVLAGPAPQPLLGTLPGSEFLRRVKTALDSRNRFPSF